jgi:Flp pilus assembly protein TadD
LNDGVQAKQEFQKFLELQAKGRERKTVPALHAQALSAMKQGDADRAIGIYREALKLDSHDAQLSSDFALALGEKGNRHEEEFQLQQAIRLDPNLAAAYHQLGLLYVNEGKAGEAGAEFRAALSIDPQYGEALVALGILYAKDGKEQNAETLFRQAIQSNPESGAGYANLGLLLAQLGRDAEAAQQLQRAAQITPHNADVLLALANLQSKVGRPVDSICTLRRLADVQDQSAQTNVELGIALAAAYSYDAALEAFSNAARLAPNSALPRLHKGRTLYDIGRIEDARHELQSACSLLPERRRAGTCSRSWRGRLATSRSR